MKANGAPEKIWINPSMDLQKLNSVIDKDSIFCDGGCCSVKDKCQFYHPEQESNVEHCISGLPLQLRKKGGKDE